MSRNWNYQKKSDTKERKERIDWATVKQKLADKHEAPFEDLCVRLPHSMGPIIIGDCIRQLLLCLCCLKGRGFEL